MHGIVMAEVKGHKNRGTKSLASDVSGVLVLKWQFWGQTERCWRTAREHFALTAPSFLSKGTRHSRLFQPFGGQWNDQAAVGGQI